MNGPYSALQRTTILSACAGTCRMFVWSDLYLRGIAPSELEIPPIGTTYRVTDRPNGVEPLDLTTNQSCASGVGSSTPSQSVEVIGCRPRLGPSGWILPKMPVRYLTFLELGPLPSDFEIWESPGPDFVNTIITLVRDGLPALKTLRLAVSLHFRAGWRWPCPLYSWPGTLDEVVLYLWKGDLDHSEIPYLELARSLAALCKRPEGCRLVQLADPEETGYGSEWDHWEDGAVPEVGITKAFGELMEWLLS